MAVIVSRQFELPDKRAASDYAIGKSVFLKVNGIKTEFIVVHHGLPSSIYDSSCNGTWLLMKNCYEMVAYCDSYGGTNDYEKSNVYKSVCNRFQHSFDNETRKQIKSVKVPHVLGDGLTGKLVTTGDECAQLSAFVLSKLEAGLSYDEEYDHLDGAPLDYFKNSQPAKRIAYYNGTAVSWWTRSVGSNNTDFIYGVADTGYDLLTGPYPTSSYGVRPCIIVKFDTMFDVKTNEVIV